MSFVLSMCTVNNAHTIFLSKNKQDSSVKTPMIERNIAIRNLRQSLGSFTFRRNFKVFFMASFHDTRELFP